MSVSTAERLMAKMTARRGERALGAAALMGLTATAVFGLLWYLVGVVRSRVTVNLGMTLLGFAHLFYIIRFVR